ncbi:flavin reductase family protein [Nocardioides sp.]|uniref:flavin reductase family protein n=1 Tax=Nocardioides sp. TaxID=35761 RepID=UPI00351362E9
MPEGISADARQTWPSAALVDSWLAYDLDLRDPGPSGTALHPGEESSLDPADPQAVAAARHFRDVIGRFASGITVVTALSNGEPVGLTCQSFSSVSLDPPLVLFVPARTSRAWPAIQRSGRFCVNVLAADQIDVSNQMASRGADKFAGLDWRPAPVTGSPLLGGTVAFVDCSIEAVHEAGDHFIVVGRVLALDAGPGAPADTDPLLYYRGAYRTTR